MPIELVPAMWALPAMWARPARDGRLQGATSRWRDSNRLRLGRPQRGAYPRVAASRLRCRVAAASRGGGPRGPRAGAAGDVGAAGNVGAGQRLSVLDMILMWGRLTAAEKVRWQAADCRQARGVGCVGRARSWLMRFPW
jgi:hypothetical protein